MDLTWNHRARILPTVSKGFTCVAAVLEAGGTFTARCGCPRSHFLWLEIEGETCIQGAGGITLALSGQMEVRASADPLTFRSSQGARGILVLLPPERFRMGRNVPGMRPAHRTAQAHPVSLSSEESSLPARLLRDCLAGIAAQIAGGPEARQIERAGELLGVLLKEAITESLEASALAADGAVPWYVSAAERQLSDCPAGPVSVMELARRAGVSPRTLHDGFRKYRGASPMKLLRSQRMQLVRQELSEPAENTSVTDTALKWGFNHLGRFSAYYLEEFGEKPSETLRLSRMKRSTIGPAARAARAS